MSKLEIRNGNTYPAVRALTGYGNKLKLLSSIGDRLVREVVEFGGNPELRADLRRISDIKALSPFTYGADISPDELSDQIVVRVRASWDGARLAVITTRMLIKSSDFTKAYKVNAGSEMLFGIWEADLSDDTWAIRGAYEGEVGHDFAMKTMGMILGGYVQDGQG